jgi:hypothetical protein
MPKFEVTMTRTATVRQSATVAVVAADAEDAKEAFDAFSPSWHDVKVFDLVDHKYAVEETP